MLDTPTASACLRRMSSLQPDSKPAKNPQAVALGRKGGRAASGCAKKRGDSAYYRALAAKRAKNKSSQAVACVSVVTEVEE